MAIDVVKVRVPSAATMMKADDRLGPDLRTLSLRAFASSCDTVRSGGRVAIAPRVRAAVA